MSETQAEQPKLEMVRVYFKNGIILDTAIPEGTLAQWTRIVRSDGLCYSADLAFPFDMVALVVRHGAMSQLVAAPTPQGAPAMPFGRPN